jgi:hypothetical protein
MHRMRNVFIIELQPSLVASIVAPKVGLLAKRTSPRAQIASFAPGPKLLHLPQPPNRPSISTSWAWQLLLLCKCDMLAQHSNPRPHASSLLPKPKLRRLLRCWGHSMSLSLGTRLTAASSRRRMCESADGELLLRSIGLRSFGSGLGKNVNIPRSQWLAAAIFLRWYQATTTLAREPRIARSWRVAAVSQDMVIAMVTLWSCAMEVLSAVD